MKSVNQIVAIVLLGLISSSAVAQNVDGHASRPLGSPFASKAKKKTHEDFIDDEDFPIYVMSRAALAVPNNANHDVLSVGAGFGVVMNPKYKKGKNVNKWGHNVGLRFIWVPKPPENPLQDFQAKVDWAWGPVLDWMAIASPRKRISFFTNISLGFIYGTPNDKNDDFVEVNGEEPTNMILPIIEGGVGIRLLSRKIAGSKTRAFIAPEVGVVPGAAAPYAAISVGFL